MDLEKAKFILSSFRPDGQDAEDKDFAEALTLAASDRELGAWLSRERAQDAAFSSALAMVEIPESLRDDIMMSLNQDPTMVEDADFDELFVGAFADIQPPSDLKDQILAAMDQQEKAVKVIEVSFSQKVRKFIPAAAAAIVVGLSAAFLTMGGSDELDTYDVQQQTGDILVNDGISLIGNNSQESMEWLKGQQLPTVVLPEKLKAMTCQGASAVTLTNGTKASLVRFVNEFDKEVNMLLIDSKSVTDFSDIPFKKSEFKKASYYCGRCEYMISRIRSGEVIVILLSQLEKEEAAEIF